MPARLNQARTKVTTPGQVYDTVAINVQGTTARLLDNGRLIESVPGVIAVEHPNRQQWTVRFLDGTTWQVERKALPCGCR